MLVPVMSSYRQQQASGQQSQQRPRRLAASALAEVISNPGAAMSGFWLVAAPLATGPRLDEETIPVDGQQSQRLVRDA